MESFEDLGLAPELVEALSSEGMEEPTPFQAAAIPVIRRGGNLLGRAGPGGGTLAAYGVALLDRLEPGAGKPRALVVAPGAGAARRLAESLSRLALATGHSVAATDGPWVLPERADVLFGAPADLLAWARGDRLDVQEVQAVVVDQVGILQRTEGLADLEALLEFLPKEAQRVVLALPVTPEVEDFVERHARRAVQVPPHAVEGSAEEVPRRGEVRYRIVEDREEGALQLVSELLEDAPHACLFFANEDRAADVGDYFALHGYASGAPGDAGVPVWLAVDELAARAALEGTEAVVVSYDPPAGADALDRRHGAGRGGTVIALAREMPHVKDVARRTGYRTVPLPPRAAAGPRGDLAALLARLDGATQEADLAPYMIALEPLFLRRGAAEVAAAAVALLRQRPAAQGTAVSAPEAPSASTREGARPAAAPAVRTPRSGGTAPTAAFVRLYISLGEKDRAGPGDLMGAITGESGVAGARIGKIDVRETFSIVEVEEAVADQVIRALNGVTIRGRAVRADYDRGGPTRSGERPARGGKPAGPRKDAGRGEGGARGPRTGGAGGPRTGGGKPGGPPRGRGAPAGGRGAPGRGAPAGGRGAPPAGGARGGRGGPPKPGGRPTGGSRPPRRDRTDD